MIHIKVIKKGMLKKSQYSKGDEKNRITYSAHHLLITLKDLTLRYS